MIFLCLPEPRRRALTVAALSAAAVAVSAPARADLAHADLAHADLFGSLEPLNHSELGEARGGMMINGIPINFAVVIRTTVEGAVTQGLQTLLTVNDQGGVGSATTTPIGTPAPGTTVTPTAGGMEMNLGSGTTLLQEIAAGQVKSFIANTMNGAKLNQHTDVNVELPGFQSMAQTWYGNSRAAQMGIDAALSGLGR